MRRRGVLLGSILLALAHAQAQAQTQDEVMDHLLTLSLDELLGVQIKVASRTETSLMDAPSVVSIITAEDIRRMGARDLRDALRHVPGFELSVRTFAYPEFGLRGVITENTEKILVLLDGLPVNEHLEGSGTIVFGDFPLDNIERIEIIRGPGSALYGTNAFVGVISLISKPSSAALELSLRGGSFNTYEGSLRSHSNWGELRLTSYLNFLTTDGDRQRIEQDAVQVRDAPPWFAGLNRAISLAGTDRGFTDNHRRKLTAQFHLDYNDLAVRALFVDARKGEYIGALYTVNEHSQGHPTMYQLDAAYPFQVNEAWKLEPRVFGRRYVADNLHNTFPPGYREPDGQGGTTVYTRGVYDLNGATQRDVGAEFKSTWVPSDRHTIVAGLSYETQSLYDLVNRRNFPDSGPERQFDLPEIIRGEPERRLHTAYVQDQWQALDRVTVTAGLRMDNYSDAGRSITPRFAMVYRPTDALSLKALYGEAFRAPTFVESYLYAFNGFVHGDENNKPETIKTSELVAIYRFGERALWQVNLYRNQIDNLLRLLPAADGTIAYQNVSAETTVNGIESELRIDFNRQWSGFANYSRLTVDDSPGGERLLGMAHTHANFGVNYAATERLNLNASVNMVGDRERMPMDAREALDSYRVVNLTLTYLPDPNLELSLSAHNLFDADQRFADVSGNVPGDFPWEGRALDLRLTWRLD